MPLQIFIDSRLAWLLRRNSNVIERSAYGLLLLQYDLNRRASVKDLIESFGIPHTEIGLIKANGISIPFEYIVPDNSYIEILAHDWPIDFSKNPLLRQPLFFDEYKFVADVNVGRLAKFLRMAGVDTYYKNGLSDNNLAEIAENERRILITKDIRLLMRKRIAYGYLVRAVRPEEQLEEAVKAFGLKRYLRPFSRCMLCNDLLVPIKKNEILNRLKPLTKRFYDIFFICPSCQNIYWNGSHKIHMEQLISRLQ